LQIASQEHRRAKDGARIASGIVVAEVAKADYVGGARVVDGIALDGFGFS
jgi:hypothetical protein